MSFTFLFHVFSFSQQQQEIDVMWLRATHMKNGSIFKYNAPIQSLTKCFPLLHLKHMSQLRTTIVGQMTILITCLYVV